MRKFSDFKYLVSFLLNLICLVNLIFSSIQARKIQKTKKIYRVYISWAFFLAILACDNIQSLQQKIPYYLVCKYFLSILINMGM